MRFQRLEILPGADCQTCGVGGAERRGFRDERADDRHAEDIGLHLHQRVVGGCPPVDSQFGRRDARVGRHSLEQVRDLKRDRFESGTRHAQAGAVERMVRLMGGKPIVLVSGGGGQALIERLESLPCRYVENLVLEGLARIGSV